MMHKPIQSSRGQRLSMYCVATGFMATASSGSEARVEDMILSGATFPVTVKEGDPDHTIDLVNDPVVSSHKIGDILVLEVNDSSPFVSVQTAHSKYGGTLIFSMEIAGLNEDNYLGSLNCDDRIDNSLPGLGGDDTGGQPLENTTARAVTGDYHALVNKRGFIGLEIPIDSKSASPDTRHFAYLEFEILRDGSNKHSITVFNGAFETTPGKSIPAGEHASSCFPWEIFQPAINAAALKN
jgi:hypothetical protein